MRSRYLFLAIGLCGLLASGCSDDTTGPAQGDSGLAHSDAGAVGNDGGDGGGDGALVGDGNRAEDGSQPLGDSGQPIGDGGQPIGDGGQPAGDSNVNPGHDQGQGHDTGSQGCLNACSKGARQCSAQDNGWQACQIGAEGCTVWAAVTPCTTGEICSGGQCMKNCINQCTDGARICSGAGYIICKKKATGCTDWTTATPCDKGKLCSGGQCVTSCSNQCTTGTRQCSGTGVQTCELNTTSTCTEWGNPIPCNQGQICSGGICVGNCTNQCAEGTSRCSGTQLQSCKLMASGCTDWDTPGPCATGSCHNGICASGVCQKGDTRCNGTTVEQCDSGGFWVVIQTCPQACDNGGCSNTVVCSSTTRRCNSEIIESCNATGTAWLYLEACPHGCKDGLCQGGCTPKATRCNGEGIETCKDDGSGWVAGKDCSATFCYSGKCAEKELKLDGQTLILEGEHVYSGDVILKGSSSIDVGPSGWLRIRAANISIDATSSIIAPARGDDPSGTGRSASCKHSRCSSSASGATGGGYGQAGAALKTSVKNCYFRGQRYCTLSASGGRASGVSHADIHMGSRGGRCTSANGGGMIDLIAKQLNSVAGNLRADGGKGSSGCAGGSGGGIRLVGEEIVATGIISAAKGASGGTYYLAGGQGRIKFLYGSKETINATTTGVVEKSVMPPMAFHSSTHPDPNRVYNDGFVAFNVSWDRPYSNALNYRFNFNQAGTSVPNWQSQKTDVESVTIPSTTLRTGDNFFHGVSVRAGATIGTLVQSIKIQINTTAPAVSSKSHPSGGWYNLSDVQLQWTNPKPDENYRAYYYVFDRYADTIPTKGDSKLPVYDKDLLIPNRPTSTVWYFHVIAEDTMGYLTKAARHFRVHVGPNPGTGSLNGDVWEDGSTPKKTLDGVELSLNRGFHKSTTANGGQYFFNNTLPAIANRYELRATKAGYETFVKEVTIKAGETFRVDIAMKKKQP